MLDKNSRLVFFGWLILSILPPIFAASARPEWALKHPWIAIPIIIGYEGLLLIIRFASRVWRDLEGRWSDRLTDYIDLLLIRRFSSFGRKYREHMRSSNRFIDLKGLATLGDYTPQFDEVFVDVSLASRPPHDVSGDPIGELPFHVAERRSIWDFIPESSPVVLAILGGPGTGKTTLLRHIVRNLHLKRKGRRNLPIFLFLREHVRKIVADSEIMLPALVRSDIQRLAKLEPYAWFDDQLGNGNCVVLLDGLDEIGQIEDRRRVAAWVERQIAQYPENDFIVTSRPYGYQSQPISNATVLQTRPFTDGQIDRFVRSWYLAIERRSTGASGEDIRQRAESEAQDLLKRLRLAPAIHGLAVNPLLLTMIVHVHRYRGSLPGSRAELYGEICQVLLWRRQDSKNLPADLRGGQKEAALKELAYIMMTARLRDMPRERVLEAFVNILQKISPTTDSTRFLRDIESNGLIVEHENGLCSFVHQTFQEFLASQFIRDYGLASELTKQVDDSWWRETIVLYSAGGQADPIIETCIKSGSVYALTVAFDCRDVAVQIAPALQSELDALLAQAYDLSVDPNRRKLMARIIVARQLRQIIQLENEASVYSAPVSVGIYRLFLADFPKLANHFPRDDKLDQIEIWSQPDRPIVGTWRSDAAAFVGWLNELIGPSAIYRLPTAAEMNLITGRIFDSGRYSAWLQPESQAYLPELWESAIGENPYCLSLSTLQSRIAADLDDVINMPEVYAQALKLLFARRINNALVYGQGVAGALGRERSPYGADDQSRETMRALTKDLSSDQVYSQNLRWMESRVRTLTRSRALYLTRKRIRIRIRTRLFSVRDPHREVDRELVINFGRSLETEFGIARKLATLLKTRSNEDLKEVVNSVANFNSTLIRQIADSDYLWTGRHRQLIDGTYSLSDVKEGKLKAGLVMALALILDEAYGRGLIGNNTKLLNHLMQRFDGSSGPYYIENLVDLANEGFKRLLKFRAGTSNRESNGESNGDERVNWCTWLSRLVHDLAVVITDLDHICIDEVDARIPAVMRLASLGILENLYRSRQLTPDIARIIEIYRDIAKGVTVFENRATEKTPRTELICLIVGA
jgi:hypothetical protein